jgi:hypothetical protein
VRLEGLGQLKNAMTSSGIDPAVFRLVAQCLNQLRYREYMMLYSVRYGVTSCDWRPTRASLGTLSGAHVFNFVSPTCKRGLLVHSREMENISNLRRNFVRLVLNEKRVSPGNYAELKKSVLSKQFPLRNTELL